MLTILLLPMRFTDRKPSDVSAALPSAIYTVDLKKLSQLAGCTQSELVKGMCTSDAVELEGVVVEGQEETSFEAVKRPENAPKIRQVLITAAARPSSLDTLELPKCLVELGGKTIIAHILSHIYAVGFDRVVISVAYCARNIMKEVQAHPLYSKMNIEFLNLGPTFRDGHARSILAAKHLLDGPFLIHTSDHIFDQTILSEMANFEFIQGVACILVETDMASIETTSMPATAVRARIQNDKVLDIGRQVCGYNAIDAGLFVSGPKLFSVLENFMSFKSYFSLADALKVFAQQKKLSYVATDSRPWVAIETDEQLEHALNSNGQVSLSPWSVFLARKPAHELRPSFLFGIPDAETHVQVFSNRHVEQRETVHGFYLDVKHRKRPLEGEDETMPLLPPISMPSKGFIQRQMQDRVRADSVPNPTFVQIPIQTESVKPTEAYIVDIEPGDTQKQLFVPFKKPSREGRKSFMHRTMSGLPTDVRNVTLETVGPSHQVQMTVQRQVPVVGFMLLVSALLASSTTGALLNLQIGAAPLMKFFWRMTVGALAFSPLAMLSMYRTPLPKVTMKLVSQTILSGVSFAVFAGSFLLAISMTSVGDAYLFNNTHSIIMVFSRMVFGIYVSHMEASGAILGLFGGVLCSLSPTATADSDSAWIGNIVAFLGAVSGVVYLTCAKKLRAQMDLFVFMWSQMVVACLFMLIYILSFESFSISMDRNIGLFGWMNPTSDRLPITLYVVLVGNMIGSMGFIGVLKYFDPIVVSVAMLMQPVVASTLGVVLGLSAFPNLLTCIGSGVVLFGTLLVILSSKQKTEHFQISSGDSKYDK